jgi:YidC/Oxa1 family membrane protein insertase
VLNFIYYPVSAILWFWHYAFGKVLGDSSGVAWSLAVVFLVFTLRAILYKPFVHQVRSMRKMQEFSPEIKKLQKKYSNDKQKLAAEMQKLQSEHGVSPLGGCLPVLVQVPVFIGLFHVLREFAPGHTQNYVFDAAGVNSFVGSHLFGAKLGATVIPYGKGSVPLADFHTTVASQLVVMIPLMIMAGFFTHLTARHNVARQTPVQLANPQSAIMNKITMYLMPIGVVVGAPFLPLAILFYWVSNNLWTLGQQRLVYKKIDQEEAEQAARKTETQRNLAPKVGQKPDPEGRQRKPGSKPVTSGGSAGTKTAGSARNGTDGVASTEVSAGSSAAEGSSNGNGKTNGAERSSANGSADVGSANGSAEDRRNGPARPQANRGRKRQR